MSGAETSVAMLLLLFVLDVAVLCAVLSGRSGSVVIKAFTDVLCP